MYLEKREREKEGNKITDSFNLTRIPYKYTLKEKGEGERGGVERHTTPFTDTHDV